MRSGNARTHCELVAGNHPYGITKGSVPEYAMGNPFYLHTDLLQKLKNQHWAAVPWSRWLERNKVLFDNTTRSTTRLQHNISECALRNIDLELRHHFENYPVNMG
ncbi:hypothetical protein A0J61_09881 [Choanephora cucurbitarum]|uniref:Uncharacterized protein n=1 Tax=Choanephora cucurbitarum TaxID=101091 RepID=A0A1C7MYZ4_9FUNG|nr:hypothetical protein A0J61_09881 [Choanephora cucurbitarum]